MPRLTKVVLHDSDDKGRQTLAYGFTCDGVGVTTAGDVQQAKGILPVEPPQVIVAVLHEASDAGLAFLRALSADDDLGRTPRLALAPDSVRPQLKTLPGSTEVLPVPTFVRDVITVAKILAATAPGTSNEITGELRGALSDYGLFFVVRAISAMRRSGVVSLERASRKGEIRFVEGEVVAAQIGLLQGPAALHQLLLWEEAALEITFRDVARRGQPFPKGDDLLSEMERFLRDFAHASKSLGHVQSLFVQDAEKAAQTLDGLPPEIVPVLRLFDGQRSLGDVLEDSPFRAFDSLRIVTRLLDAGAIRRKAIERPSNSGAVRRPRMEDWPAHGFDNGVKAPSSGEPSALLGGSPSAVDEGDQRTGAGDRRKDGRRERSTTAELYSVSPALLDEPPTAPEPRASPGSPALAAPSRTNMPSPTIAAGDAVTKPVEVKAQGEIRSTRKNVPTVVSDVPSMVIDLGPPVEAAAPSIAAPARPSPASIAAPPVAVAAPPVAVAAPPVAVAAPPVAVAAPPVAVAAPQVPAPVAVAAPPVAVAAASVAVAGPPMAARPVAPSGTGAVMRTTGVHSAEFAVNARPSAGAVVAPAGGPSIQLDPRLMAEMDAFELANSPATPPPATVAQPATVAPPVTAPLASPAPRPSGAGPLVSFVRGGATPAPTPLANLNGPGGLAASPLVVAAPGAGAVAPVPARATPTAGRAETPPPTSGRSARASGEFNALEADFFAREADLYKHDKVENFDDLEGGRHPGRPRR